MGDLKVVEHDPPAHLRELRLDAEPAGLVLLPDSVSPVGDDLVAGFRDGAQELRVAALEQGMPVSLVTPEGTRRGQYSEHAADWVLPIVQGFLAGVPATLVATYVQLRLDGWRETKRSHDPVVRVQELIVSLDGEQRLRTIEGPAPEMLEWLRDDRGALVELPEGDDRDG